MSPRSAPLSAANAAPSPADPETMSSFPWVAISGGTICKDARKRRKLGAGGGLGAERVAARIERISQAVPEQVEGEGRQKHGETRPEHEQRAGEVVLRRVCEEVSPARVGRLDSEAEEREPRIGQDEVRDDQRRVDGDRRD